MDIPTVSDTNTYHTARGNTDWTGLTTTQKEQSILRASDYVRRKYADRLLSDLEDDDATYLEGIMMLAREAEFTSNAALLLSEQQALRVKKELEGVGSTETEYRDEGIDRYPELTAFYSPILKPLRAIRVSKLVQ